MTTSCDPSELGDQLVEYYSIPAYDTGSAQIVPASSIQSNKFLVPDEAVLVSRLNPHIPRVWLVSGHSRYLRLCSTEFVPLIPQQPTSSLFVYQLCRSPGFLSALEELVTGTTGSHQRVDRSALLHIPVPLPPLSEQRAIAEVLGALDDKIEANRRVATRANQLAALLLEQMLQQAVTKQSAIQVRLGDIAAINVRSVTSSLGRLRYLDIASVGDGTAGQPTSMDWSEAPSRARRGVADGDTLWSTVRPNRRSHCLILDPPPDLVVSTGFAVLTPTGVGPSLLYGLTDRREFTDFLTSSADGSAYPAVRAERILDASLVLPPPNVQQSFEESTMPLRRLVHAVAQESIVLSTLRDALLPKLLSGELRVKDAEPLVETAL